MDRVQYPRTLGRRCRLACWPGGSSRRCWSGTEDAEGHVALGISAGGYEAGVSATLVSDPATALRRPPDPTDPLGALREVRIIAARLAITSQQYKLSWVAPRADLTLL